MMFIVQSVREISHLLIYKARRRIKSTEQNTKGAAVSAYWIMFIVERVVDEVVVGWNEMALGFMFHPV
jgi:hypothetical protein